MKKAILLLIVLLTANLLQSQQSKFTGNYSTKSLKEIQNTIPQKEKHEFYKQYFRALFFEELKTSFSYKNYSDIALKKFTDTIFAKYQGDEIINNDSEVFKPSRTLKEHIQIYNKNIKQDPEEINKYLTDRLTFKNEKEKKEFLEMQKKHRQYFPPLKEMTPEELKTEYELFVADEKERFENDPSTSIGLSKIISNLDTQFPNQKNSEDFHSLLEKNLSSSIGYNRYFPYPSSEGGENSIYESIPGEILTHSIETGSAMGRNLDSYKIIGNDIVPINPFPKDENFYKKVSKYAKKGWRFEGRVFYDISKINENEYLISTMIYSEKDYNSAPSMNLEYKTKDFKNFTPLRISKNDEEKENWQEIK